MSPRKAGTALLAALFCAVAGACGTAQSPPAEAVACGNAKAQQSPPAVAAACGTTQAQQPLPAEAAACGTTQAAPSAFAIARSGQIVMGTVLTVTVIATDETLARRLADEAIAEAHRWDDVLTIWRPEGELARFNTRAGDGAVSISPSLAEGLTAMLRLAKETGGAFDPAAGSAARHAVRLSAQPPALVAASERAVTGRSPAEEAGLAGVLRVNGASASLQAGASIDPGAIGKGIALDAAAKLLRRGGAAAAFLDFGGSSQLAIGAPPEDPRGWTVAVSGLAADTSHGVLHLRDGCLSTSRAGALDTVPILDPRDGSVVAPPRLATVLAPDATSADAWSTALIVLGTDGTGVAAAKGLETLFEDGSGLRRSTAFPLGPPEKFPAGDDFN